MVKVNHVILIKDEDESRFYESRIVRIDRDPTKAVVWLFRLNGKNSPPTPRPLHELEQEISKGLVVLTDWVPETVFLAESELTPFQAGSFATAKELLNELKERAGNPDVLCDKAVRGQLISLSASTLGILRDGFYRVLYRWWRNGMTDEALIPTNGRSNKGRVAVQGQRRRGPKAADVSEHSMSADVRNIVITVTRKWAGKKYGKEGIYRKVTEALGAKTKDSSGKTIHIPPTPDRAVSWRQFLRIYEQLNFDGSLDRLREGSISWDLGHSTSLLNAHEQLNGPGAEYQIDDTGCQVEVVDPTGQAIGALFIILVIDTWSNLITGFHADLGSATAEAYALAFYNSIIDKVSFCAYYGIEITSAMWPASGVPVTYHSDKGSAFTSNRTESYVVTIPIGLSCARSHEGNAKGDIENRIKSIKTNLFRYLTGYRKKAGQQRGEGDPKKKAVFTIYEIRALVIEWIITQNNTKPLTEAGMPMIARTNRVEATALAVWKWGAKNLSSPLKSVSDKELWIRLLPERDVRITHRGIEYRNSRYTCAKYERDRVFEYAKNNAYTMKARVDDMRPDLIYLHEKESGELIPCERIVFAEGVDKWSHADADAMHQRHLEARGRQAKTYKTASTQQMVSIGEANKKAELRAKALGHKSTSKNMVRESRIEEQARVRVDDTNASYAGYEAPPIQKPKKSKATSSAALMIEDELDDLMGTMD